jgi:hypothetical protein
LSPTDETVIVSADGNQVATTFQGHRNYDQNYERRASDALLIAAAPDLLHALDHLIANGISHPKAVSAIAKARGKA